LGASVVRGEGSSNGNGYRKELSSAVNKTKDRTNAATTTATTPPKVQSFTSSYPNGFSARSSDSGFSGQLNKDASSSRSGSSKTDGADFTGSRNFDISTVAGYSVPIVCAHDVSHFSSMLWSAT
jgi:hypothetical protein